MKRRFWMLIVVLMCVSLMLPGCASESAEGQVMLPGDSVRILQEYSKEIDYVADCTGVPITEIDYDAVQRIRDVQVNWENQYPAPAGDLRMEELVTEIVDAILLYRSIMDNGTLAIGTTVNRG